MKAEEFREKLLGFMETHKDVLVEPKGGWKIKGFASRDELYTISNDTKVLSKILEIQIFPLLGQFAEENNFTMELAKTQNQYPDMTFREKYTDQLIAVDLKTTYVTGNDACNGFTLGAYTGYFINRSSTKNILYPYSAYDYHFILGILYTRGESNERTSYELSDIDNIPSVISDLQFIVQEKYRVALRRPGSGNTKNIGGVRSISKLINGNGDFNSVEEFDDFWMNYDERKKEKKRKQSEERDK